MPFDGLTVEFCQQIEAQVIVRGLRVFSDFEYEFRLALANHQLAPDIETVALITSKEHTFLSSTTVREIALLAGDVSSMVSGDLTDLVALDRTDRIVRGRDRGGIRDGTFGKSLSSC